MPAVGFFPESVKTERYKSLDAVRGIASVMVVLDHCYQTILSEGDRSQFDTTIGGRLLLVTHNGDAAVVIFFVLSGFVLSTLFLRENPLTYWQYFVRRVCRIYLPFAAAILFSIILYKVSDHRPVNGLSAWFNTLWPQPPLNTRIVVNHFLMAGTEHSVKLDAPMWTLVYELRISLILPLLIWLTRWTIPTLCAAAFLLWGSVDLLGLWGQDSHPAHAMNLWFTFLWTSAIVPYFLAGILLYRHRDRFKMFWSGLSQLKREAMFLIPAAIFSINPTFSQPGQEALYIFAAACVVVVAIESELAKRILDSPVPQWLGSISYSLYLVHLPIMLLLIPKFAAYVPNIAAVTISVSLAIFVAWGMHFAVELPAMKLGRYLAKIVPN